MRRSNIFCILTLMAIFPLVAICISSPFDSWSPFDAFDTTTSSFDRWKSPSLIAQEIRRQALGQSPLASMLFATALGAANAALTVSVDSRSEARDRSLGKDVGQLQEDAKKTASDISSLQSKVTALESSQGTLCKKVLELIAGWEQFNTDLGAITGAAPDLVTAISAIVANKPTCS